MDLITMIGIGVFTLVAGVLGSMLGLGGGVFIVPVLSLFFGVSLKTAIAASAVAVVANSVVGSTGHLHSGFTNLNLAMLMEVATTIGALTGGLIAVYIAPGVLRVVFGVVLLYVAYAMLRKSKAVERPAVRGPDPFGLGMAYRDPATGKEVNYVPHRLLIGLPLSAVAGVLSGLLGIGGGVVKVPIMNTVMGVPLKAAAGTSTFMVGITVSASAFVYYSHGYIDPSVTVPAVFGIVIGARTGSILARRVHSAVLVKVLVAVLAYLAISLLLQASGIHMPGTQ